MASGIISDTLNLRSPTTTDFDRQTLHWLKSLSGIDMEQFIQEFFEIGSALRTHPAEQVVVEDCKEFTDHGFRFSISQIEEIGFDLFWDRRHELHAALLRLTEQRKLAFAALLVTDIVSSGSMLLLSHEPDFWEAIHFPTLERFLYKLDGVVSRKKQLLPLITQLLENAAIEAALEVAAEP
jgi:manganese-dependent inorganic pyrophosphatase